MSESNSFARHTALIDKFFRILIVSMAVAILTACGGGGGSEARSVVVVFGDSLSNNNGQFVTSNEHWTEKLKAERPGSTIVVSALSGETAADAVKRLPSVLATHRPTHIIISHGTNDYWRACRGCYAQTQKHLEDMAMIANENGVVVILGDMTYKRGGPPEASAYSAMYRSAAGATGSRYVNMVANIPYDRVHYHSDMIHYNNNSQEALKNSVVNTF
ncbi:GDSL-type esterase/lipase family protein [Hydrogenophaga sp.]|uniref:GDSL-type esterase/lipase family protein n=1 Tax=Hydrogenophaga sp. TaxID=1904254 RepID=UPI0027272438|nr:GDSL-type esterase/lipase family protein [Hydrogenophaga sp.]MDO8903663.1 GDSL-type esterase/lipase family protein [Hydrogenophaga sp.]